MRNLIAKIKKKVLKQVMGYRVDSETYLAHLKSIGMSIGEGVTIFGPRTVVIDAQTPCMVEIGNNVQITAGVTILTHGFDWSVLKGYYGEVLGSRGKVTIGNNVFIGTNSTILKGVTIGSNVIIGACSVVTHDIPNNCVAVGSPARVVMSLEEYHNKRLAAQYTEAAALVREYRRVFGCDPSADDLSEFFWLFTDSAENLPESWMHQMRQAGNYETSIEKLKKNEKMFDSMEDFLKSVK